MDTSLRAGYWNNLIIDCNFGTPHSGFSTFQVSQVSKLGNGHVFFLNHKDDQIMINFQNDCESYLNFKSKIFLVIVKQKRGFLVISQFVGHWISFT